MPRSAMNGKGERLMSSVRMPYRAPSTARQETLCTIFAEVLGITQCGLDDDFFGLGGRSLDAMVIAGRVSAAIGRDMSMDDLFDAPTVAELDRRLDGIADGWRDQQDQGSR